MNLNDAEDDRVFNEHCLELAKLLRTDQTEDFLRLYDSLPPEWNGSRLEEAKEYIRQLQELDEDIFQRAFETRTNLMSKQSPVIPTDQPTIMTTNNRITSLPLLQQKQHQERITANNLACDETHDLIKRNNDESNTKTRRLQSITNNNTPNTSRTCTDVDSFVQLNLKPAVDSKPDIHITLEDYKKARDKMPTTKSSDNTNRSSNPNESNSILKKSKISSHEEASFNYFHGNDDQPRVHSRSSSSSSSTNHKNDLSINQINTFGHSKLIANNDFDSHGSSIATKSSSENSGSVRTGSATDSDDEHKPTIRKSTQFFRDATPTIVLKQTTENPTSQHDRLSTLPDQDSFELVKLNPTDEPPLHGPIPRFKQPAIDDPNGLHNDSPPYPTQRSQQNYLSSSSQQNRNPERHDQHNSNHSNSSRKANKKRKQSQQQDIIRTELIPGHRGDLDVDELVMFIDGNSSTKQRQNSVPLRPTDTNSNPTSRRKSRKPTKSLQDNENKTIQIDESISFIDDDDQTTTHSLTEQSSLPNDDESHSTTTNGEISLPEWHSISSTQDDIEPVSLSSTILNNTNSEILSEPFVTVTHRRRSIKERRPDLPNNSNSPSSSRTSRFPDKRRYQPIQNGIVRPTIPNTKPSVSTTTTTKEEPTTITSPPSVSQTSTSVSNQVLEQSSPRLSSQSSSSSLSSSLKRQSKAPPVVFLNKSNDVELNDVSFGFDVENSTTEEPPTPPPPTAPSVEKEVNSPPPPPSSSSPRRSQPQRNPRGPMFYSGSDIRPQQHRNYPPPSQSPYIDPLVLLQYNQQRYQQLAYMNLLRTQYLPSQSPYVLIPTTTTTSYETNPEEKDETSEQIQEPLLVYTTMPGQTGPIYYQSTKKSFQSVYPPQYFYPTHPAYFQPISSPASLLLDSKSQHDETDNDEDDDTEENDVEKSTRLFQQTRQQSSSHIMSNALQLVYSQEKRNAQTDRFNLDQLTAYLAMKWTDTIDRYDQGDDEILLTSEQ